MTRRPPTDAATNQGYIAIPMLYTVPSALSIATTARVGALLAQGRVRAARRLTRAVAVLTVALGSVTSLSLYALKVPVVAAFTTEADVEQLAYSVWPFLCAFIFVDVSGGRRRPRDAVCAGLTARNNRRPPSACSAACCARSACSSCTGCS